MDKVISTRDFSISNLAHSDVKKMGSSYISSVSYAGRRCILQTPKCQILEVNWEKGYVILELSNTKFKDNVTSIDASHVTFAKSLRGCLFSKEITDEVFERLFRPNVKDGKLRLQFRPSEPFKVFDSANTKEEIPIEEFQEGRVANIMFEVRGVGIGSTVFGGTWMTLQARVQVPVEEPEPEPEPEPEREQPPPEVLDFADDDEDIEGPGWTTESVQNEEESVPTI